MFYNTSYIAWSLVQDVFEIELDIYKDFLEDETSKPKNMNSLEITLLYCFLFYLRYKGKYCLLILWSMNNVEPLTLNTKEKVLKTFDIINSKVCILKNICAMLC